MTWWSAVMTDKDTMTAEAQSRAKAVAVNITILARMLNNAVKEGDSRAVMRHVGSIGEHLNKIIGEVTK